MEGLYQPIRGGRRWELRRCEADERGSGCGAVLGGIPGYDLLSEGGLLRIASEDVRGGGGWSAEVAEEVKSVRAPDSPHGERPIFTRSMDNCQLEGLVQNVRWLRRGGNLNPTAIGMFCVQ